ncbi:adenine phosphoribosyltransferase [Candidatus Lucifugimonas marina]|uniref:Adenine phosphoribosyltransferase n=1 Tax=Candidatus Lucifugimonas marina TaxID=3038979 RepID=A0AAJ5ZBN0_9CHLR|nr:adenine phosphoribosyltransferase [SAR202 cluster bacterium JH702]MDG0869642.1 adenine phosphoribosyltransferase [SAR202 cluster bacterium JH639]WFG34375.1 adenine phosphoribosyltransferase [SAR202 cluster bacterium JH545]WFG38304.1 adenine phosphoribosyltransferase [SAR202 cluster bacterium JH1073]
MDLKSLIRDVPDYPSEGILFRDLTPVMADPQAMKFITDGMSEHLSSLKVESIAAIDSRGFIFGAPIAAKLDIPFVPIRKAGKLPPPVIGVDYALEYGTARLELSTAAVDKGQRVAVVDDLLATGGSAGAGMKLITDLGAEVVSAAFLVELEFLDARSALPSGIDVFSMVRY